MPAEGEDTREHIQKKYGLSDAQLAENQARIRERGAEVGFTFHPEGRSRIVNTFDAHRLLHWAGVEGKQAELKHALLRAYFTERQDVSDRDTLVRIASDVGLSQSTRARSSIPIATPRTCARRSNCSSAAASTPCRRSSSIRNT